MAGAAVLCLIAGARPAPAQEAPRVAVFDEPTFPTYGLTVSVGPRQIAQDLRAAGLAVDLLNTDALQQPARFDARRYAAVVLPYGNTFPREAFANLQKFHRAGGSLITTGIPFTHPVERVGAQGWTATPAWGQAVRRVENAGGHRFALQVAGDTDHAVSVAAPRFALAPGDSVAATVTVAAMPVASPATNRQDTLQIRFYSKGRFIGQKAVSIAQAQANSPLTVQATAPTNANRAEIVLRIEQAGSRYRFSDFVALVNGRPVALPNGDLSRRDPAVWFDTGNTNTAARWGADGIGVGGFAGPDRGVLPVTLPAADPWHLRGVVAPTQTPRPNPQWLDPRSTPAGVSIVPALGDAARPLAALVVHTGDQFAPAVDAWTLRGYTPDRDVYETRQIIARATVAALARRGKLRPAQAALALRGLARAPRPVIYANLTLPVVPRRYQTFQPKMPPPARHLLVADVRHLTSDERLLLISLQGIVNRREPRIYLLFDDDDALWLREMQKQGETDAPETVADPFTLLTRFRREWVGAVVCDPKVYDSPCVAVALAGIDNLLIARTAALASRLHLPVKRDLRGKFRDNADALGYIRTQLSPRLDPYLTCSLDPARYDKGGLDQIIAARGGAFWVTGPKAADFPGANGDAEVAEVRKTLAAMPLGAVVRGFWWDGDGMGLDEEAGVALGSRLGKITLVSDLITNLSVHSGVKATKLVQKPRPPAPPLDRTKVYLSFTMSDGDNLCTWRGYFRRYFDDPVRGQVPVGWGMGPTLIDLAPVWARWYYNAATPNDEFICDVSGAAYLYPPDWGLSLRNRPAALHQFYDLTQTYMDRMDMKTLRLMNIDTPTIAQVGTLLPRTAFLMPDYGHAGAEAYPDLTYTLPTGQPVFRAITNGSGPANLAAQIRRRAGVARPAFVNAFIWNWGSNLSDLKKTLELLGPEYVAVLPSNLNTLYREAQKSPTATHQVAKQ